MYVAAINDGNRGVLMNSNYKCCTLPVFAPIFAAAALMLAGAQTARAALIAQHPAAPLRNVPPLSLTSHLFEAVARNLVHYPHGYLQPTVRAAL